MKFCFAFICCFLLTACQANDESKSSVNLQKKDGSSKNQKEITNLTVWLTPEPLSSDSPAVATIRNGSSNTKITWYVSGQQIETEKSSKLSNQHFRRDDEVSVTVESEGMVTQAGDIVQNSPPRIHDVNFAESKLIAGKQLTIIPDAEDIDDDQINFSYQWTVNDRPLVHDEATLPGEYVQRGNQITLQIIPSDDQMQGEPFTTQNFAIPNSAPQIISNPPDSIDSLAYEYQVDAYDPDGDRFTYQLAGAPEGMTISETGLLSWQIKEQPAEEFKIEIIVEDTEGSDSRQTLNINLAAQE
jgi:Putative Ig domain